MTKLRKTLADAAKAKNVELFRRLAAIDFEIYGQHIKAVKHHGLRLIHTKQP